MNNSEEHKYHVGLKWKEGRIGTLSSPELNTTIEVATPPEFPGGVEGIWSPEHLFVASISSCFMTSFTAVANFSNFEFESLNITSSGIMSKVDGKFVMSKIILKPVLIISDEINQKKANRLLEKAEEICLITRSVKSEVVVESEIGISVPA